MYSRIENFSIKIKSIVATKFKLTKFKSITISTRMHQHKTSPLRAILIDNDPARKTKDSKSISKATEKSRQNKEFGNWYHFILMIKRILHAQLMNLACENWRNHNNLQALWRFFRAMKTDFSFLCRPDAFHSEVHRVAMIKHEGFLNATEENFFSLSLTRWVSSESFVLTWVRLLIWREKSFTLNLGISCMGSLLYRAN